MFSVLFKNSVIVISLMLFCLKGKTQENLYSDSISVNFFLLDQCKISEFYAPSLHKFAEEYDEFHFVGYFPNFSSKKIAIDKFSISYQIPFDLKTDYFKSKTQKFDVTILPTVVVFDEKREKILYKGKIDDRFHSVGKQKRYVKNHYLKNALKNIESNKSIDTAFTQAVGCFVNFADSLSK